MENKHLKTITIILFPFFFLIFFQLKGLAAGDIIPVPYAGSYFVGWETTDGVPLGDIQNAQPGEVVIAVFDMK